MSEIRVDKLKNEAGSGAVELTEGASIPTGKNLTGAGGINITGDIVTTGTITYEDVTNVDSLGIVTARGGLEVGTSGAGGTITSAGDAVFAGLTTARLGGVTETVSVASTSHYIPSTYSMLPNHPNKSYGTMNAPSSLEAGLTVVRGI